MGLTDAERTEATAPPVALLERAMREKGASNTKTFELRETGETLLTAPQRERIIQFLDAVPPTLVGDGRGGGLAGGGVSPPRRPDIKITLSSEAFEALLSGVEDPSTTYTQLISLHPLPRASKIALRRTEAPVDGCIPFHCDGENKTVRSTVQLTLNDVERECEGGRLCYFTKQGGLVIPNRPAEH